MRRRPFVEMVGLALAGLAGCSGDGGDDAANEIAVATDGSLSFAPETTTVSAGTTVTWRFESPSHNVSCDPDHHEDVSLPDGADAFVSYDGDERLSTLDAGETFEHTFEVTGTYDYVCVPHASNGMVGTVDVVDG